ncbi:MAG TPA: helix-turn-helix transcriptional regulator [Bacilli bacterium]|nr:helix-turn-helix transcriptional regulator [Bacilli bacterium]
MIIGNRVRTARVNKGYSQEELGKLINVSKVSICGYETGNRTPTLNNFMDLVKVLDVEPNYLLGLDVDVICDDAKYSIKMAKEDIDIIKELKNHPELYNKIANDSKRTIELISRRVK